MGRFVHAAMSGLFCLCGGYFLFMLYDVSLAIVNYSPQLTRATANNNTVALFIILTIAATYLACVFDMLRNWDKPIKTTKVTTHPAEWDFGLQLN